MRLQLIRKANNTSLVLIICATLCGETVAQDKTNYASGDVSNGFSAQAYPMSQNGWARNGFTAEERDKLIAAGFPNGDEAIKWSSVLSKAGQVAPNVIGTYYRAGKHFGFDAADLGAIFDAIGQNPPSQRMEAEEIFREAVAVHGGANAGQVYGEYLARDKKRKDEAQTLDAIGIYGADLVRKCGGIPVAMAPLMAFDDPYASKGKCYTALISDQWGEKQWIDENTILLMTVIPGTTQAYSTVFMDPSNHLKFGHKALVIGASPTSYTAVSGAQTVAPVFIVLKYLD